jgi:hypothetical protein
MEMLGISLDEVMSYAVPADSPIHYTDVFLFFTIMLHRKLGVMLTFNVLMTGFLFLKIQHFILRSILKTGNSLMPVLSSCIPNSDW